MSKQQQWMRSRPDGPLHKPDISCESNGCWPVAVIDPEDREQVERLDDLIYSDRFDHEDTVLGTQAALREFANPKPPRPDEPQGLGAVVEDADGTVWLSNRFDSTITWRTPWFSSDLDEWRDWSAIEVARVLNDGWVQQ